MACRNPLNKFVENSHFQIENISCNKSLPSKGRLYGLHDHPRPQRRLPFCPSPERLPDVSAISEEKHMFCLSRPLLWLKYCSKGLCQTLKTSGRTLTQSRRSYDLLSRRLPYPRFASPTKHSCLLERQRNTSPTVTLFENLGFKVVV